MKRFIEGQHPVQSIFLPECLVDFVDQDNPVGFMDVYVAELNLATWSDCS